MSPVTARLPGVQPLDWAAWLEVDDAFAGQMALKERLLATQKDAVLAQTPPAEAACREVLDVILGHLGPGYTRTGGAVIRPDGGAVALRQASGLQALETAARLVQEDLCLLQADGAEHVLTAAALCFPASWSLDEKIGRPLRAIHGPVESYTADIAQRVQRLFDAIQPERPLWRQNALCYADPSLFQPRREADPRDDDGRETPFLRSEKQCLLRLPKTRAVVFSIHTYVVRIADLPVEMRDGLADQERQI